MLTDKQYRYINYLLKVKKWEDTIVCTYDIVRMNYMTKFDASCLISDLLKCEDKEDLK